MFADGTNAGLNITVKKVVLNDNLTQLIDFYSRPDKQLEY
jgi:hypothetical protein